jgi:hypothetical protein
MKWGHEQRQIQWDDKSPETARNVCPHCAKLIDEHQNGVFVPMGILLLVYFDPLQVNPENKLCMRGYSESQSFRYFPSASYI